MQNCRKKFLPVNFFPPTNLMCTKTALESKMMCG